MQKEYFYQVAGWGFALVADEQWDVQRLLPSFAPFRVEDTVEELFRFEVVSRLPAVSAPFRQVEEAENDFGHTLLEQSEEGYRVTLHFASQPYRHVLWADAAFTSFRATLAAADFYVDRALGSMLRIAYAQAVLLHGGISLHASAVVYGGKSFLFLGKSGTGKSTHAALWQQTFPGCWLLNDDNPTLRLERGVVMAYGSPWSGKTPCYHNQGFPVQGIVRLHQAPCNAYLPQEEFERFVALLPSCTVIRTDVRLYEKLCDTLAEIISLVEIGQLKCLPEVAAARICAENLGVSVK